jgi:hypothetical protein
MLGNGHVRFGGRTGETHSVRAEQGAPVRPLHLCGDLVRLGGGGLGRGCLQPLAGRLAGSRSLRTDLAWTPWRWPAGAAKASWTGWCITRTGPASH